VYEAGTSRNSDGIGQVWPLEHVASRTREQLHPSATSQLNRQVVRVPWRGKQGLRKNARVITHEERSPVIRSHTICLYTYSPEHMTRPLVNAVIELPCACGDLRRVARIVTRIYDQELKSVGLEISQHNLLIALDKAGEVNQKWLSMLLVMDSTTLTRSILSHF